MHPDLTGFRRRLENGLRETDAALAQAGSAAATVVLDQSSVGRLSRMDALQQQAMASGLRERLALRRRQLQAALDRITAGTYGLCCQCEAAMEPDRLDNDPAAVFCADCMAERETRGDRIGDR
jgi:DnaK suppressor protein